MIDKNTLIERLCMFTDSKLEAVAKTNPVIGFLRPVLARALRKKISGITNLLDFISDEKGDIDVISIVGEMADSVMNTQPFKLNVPPVGDIIIGGGRIEFGIPFTDRNVVLDSRDIGELRDMLVKEC